MEEFPRKARKNSSEGLRAWRAPENDLDTAVGEFLKMTEREGATRKEAFEKVTEHFSSKKVQDFLDQLSIAEKTAPKPVSVERVASKKKESFDERKVVSALRAFHAHAVAVASDMPLAFDEVSEEMKLSPGDKNELARRIMGMFTKKDLEGVGTVPEDESDGPSGLSDNSTLITRDQKIDDLNAAAAVPEDVTESIAQRLRNRKARIHLNEDGTAHIVGEKPGRRRGRRVRREATN